jgi:hypothetical protein
MGGEDGIFRVCYSLLRFDDEEKVLKQRKKTFKILNDIERMIEWKYEITDFERQRREEPDRRVSKVPKICKLLYSELEFFILLRNGMLRYSQREFFNQGREYLVVMYNNVIKYRPFIKQFEELNAINIRVVYDSKRKYKKQVSKALKIIKKVEVKLKEQGEKYLDDDIPEIDIWK